MPTHKWQNGRTFRGRAAGKFRSGESRRGRFLRVVWASGAGWRVPHYV